jgi:hypothetical protein
MSHSHSLQPRKVGFDFANTPLPRKTQSAPNPPERAVAVK